MYYAFTRYSADLMKQLFIRLIVIVLSFWGGYAMLSIFFDAFLRKIPPPFHMFPQLYFALGYFLFAIGLYLLFVTARKPNHD